MHPQTQVIKVAVVEDADETRESLTALLNGTPGLRCVGSYKTAEEALEGMRRGEPNVTLMDIELPGMSGIECTARLKTEMPNVAIVMLTIFADTELLFTAIQAGAVGYLLKGTPPAQIVDAITRAQSGDSPMSAPLARRIVEFVQKAEFALNSVEIADSIDVEKWLKADGPILTRRQKEVLWLLARGLSHKEIGSTLGIALNTVHNHFRTIYERLDVHKDREALLKFLAMLSQVAAKSRLRPGAP